MTDRDELRDRLDRLEDRLKPLTADDVPWDVPSREEREAAPPGVGLTKRGEPGIPLVVTKPYTREEVLDLLPPEQVDRLMELEETVEREGARDDDGELTTPATHLMGLYFDCADYELEARGL